MVKVLERLQNIRKNLVYSYYTMWKEYFSWRCSFYKPVTPAQSGADIYQVGVPTSLQWTLMGTFDVLVVNGTRERYQSKAKSDGMNIGYGDVFGLDEVRLLVKYDVVVDRGWKVVGSFMDREYVFYVQTVKEDFSQVFKVLEVKP